MPSPSDAAVTAGVVRDTVPFSRLPWIRPLVEAHAHAFPSVAAFFAGSPADATAWQDTIARVQRPPRPFEVADLVLKQQNQRGAPAAAREAAAMLRSRHAVAILTGQQAGLFGGPFYTLLKAITAIQLARHVTTSFGVPAVPVFWVDAEDHDWEEVRSTQFLDRESLVATVALEAIPGCGSQPVGALRLDEAVTHTIEALSAGLPETEFSATLIASLRDRYRAGATVSGAFAGLLEDLLGAHGLVVFESSDPLAKPPVADLFAAEIAEPGRTARLAREAGAAMARLGHSAQIEMADDVVCVFYVNGSGRQPVRYRDGQFVIGDRARSGADLRDEVLAHPERFSPNVLLRPLVQDRLFPTACYVAGPSELAYQAQLGPVYTAFGVEQPLLASRASATIIDSAAARFLDRHEVPLEALQPQDESALNRLLERQLPPSLDDTIQQTLAHLSRQAVRLKEDATVVDPTLSGAVDTTIDRMSETLKTLQGKIVQASKKKDETLRRQFIRTRTLAFPGGQPQERALGVAFFINRYGPGLVDRLLETLPPVADRHYVLVP